jgi:hypothetical protein
VICPFREGPETLDLLLAEIDVTETALLDAALDLRSVMHARHDAAAALWQLYRLRAILDGRHYLAFYRVRCWIHRHVRAEVRAWRGAVWMQVPLPRDCGRFDAALNTCLAELAASDAAGWHETASVRFRFASDVELEHASEIVAR